MAWLDRDADHSSAARFDDVAPDDGVLSPIGAFDEDVRLEGGNQIVRRVLVEDDDAVDAGEPFEDLRTLRLGGMGRSGPLIARTDRSEFTPTNRASPRPRACWR